MSIEVRNVTKRFGDFVAVDDVSLAFPGGELTALLGPSGSGKTSLLRIIAGLERADRGQVLFSGEDTTRRDVRERGVGFVFQHYALFRHMTVFENVAFGLDVRPRASRPSREAIRARVMDLLALVQLDWLAGRYPTELSGGQRQRVALARALAVEPKLLLLDEPFGSLDAKVRLELRRWLRRLHDTIHLTSIFVTHDQEEAMEVADRVVVMSHGTVQQVGTPREVFDHPANAFVMAFLGHVNLLGGGYVRPHEFDVSRSPSAEAEGGLWATVRHVAGAGGLVRLELETEPSGVLHVELPRDTYEALDPRLGERLHLRPRRVRTFEGTGPLSPGEAPPIAPSPAATRRA
jgi:sulfate/thiosulfate transport system ATP-binding protein